MYASIAIHDGCVDESAIMILFNGIVIRYSSEGLACDPSDESTIVVPALFPGEYHVYFRTERGKGIAENLATFSIISDE